MGAKESLYMIKTQVDLHRTFALMFFNLNNIYIHANFFVNKLTRWVQNGSFLEHSKTLAARVLSDTKILSYTLCLYI